VTVVKVVGLIRGHVPAFLSRHPFVGSPRSGNTLPKNKNKQKYVHTGQISPEKCKFSFSYFCGKKLSDSQTKGLPQPHGRYRHQTPGRPIPIPPYSNLRCLDKTLAQFTSCDSTFLIVRSKNEHLRVFEKDQKFGR